MTSLIVCVVALVAPPVPERPTPRVVFGDALPEGAVARFGPTAFRYAGVVNVLHNAGPTIWYSRDGKRVGVTSSGGVSVWETGTGKRLLWVPTDGQLIAGLLALTPDGDAVVDCRRKGSDSGNGVFRIDLTTGKVKSRFQPQEEHQFAAVSPDGQVAFSFTRVNASETETVATEIDTGKQLWRRRTPKMCWMRVSPDSSRLVMWSSWAHWDVDILDAATGKSLSRFDQRDNPSQPTWTSGAVAVGPKAERIVGAHAWNRGFTVLEPLSETPFRQESGTWHESAFLTSDGKTAVLVLSGRAGYDVETWDLVALKRLSSVPASVGRTVTLSPDGTTLAAAADYRMPPHALSFFDVATGKKSPVSPEPFTQAAVVWYLPDGSLASADEKFEKPVKWDAKTGTMSPLPAGTKPPPAVKLPAGFKPPVGLQEVTVSPDGTRVLGYRVDPEDLDSAPGDNYVGLFDAKGKVLGRYERPDNTDGARWAFSADGATFAIARGDGTITFSESETGLELRTVRHAGGVTSLAFSPDGKHLATACGDGPVLVWDAPAQKPKK